MRVAELPDNEGLVASLGGRTAAIYRNGSELVVLSGNCTHRECQVEWSAGDNEWHCPCHGSVFDIKGDVLRGPANRPLEKLRHTVEGGAIKLA